MLHKSTHITRLPKLLPANLLASIILLSLLTFTSSLLQAHPQFNASCINLKQGLDNTAIYLRLEPSLFHIDPKTGNLSADLQMRISFRKMPECRMVLVRQKTLQFSVDFMSEEDPFFYAFTMGVSPGNYEVWIEIEDYRTRRAYIESIPYVCRDMDADVALSDPLLVQEFGGILAPQPLLGNHFTSVPEQLRMTAFVYTRIPDFYRAKAVLYLRQNSAIDSPIDADQSQSSQYLTMNQMNAVVDARRGFAILGHQLDLADLPHGEYLVELYLFKEDSLVAEAARSFFIDWKRLRDVFGDLNAAIDRMAWIATPSRIAQLKSIKDTDEQQKAFLAFWAERANPPNETAVDAIERYYSRIFYAIENFDEGIPGWQTDRGKTLTLYGPPNHQSSMKFNGRLFEAWTYSRWGMKFLFRNDDGKMHKVEIG
jgi:GWxTD domain-containing protein